MIRIWSVYSSGDKLGVIAVSDIEPALFFANSLYRFGITGKFIWSENINWPEERLIKLLRNRLGSSDKTSHCLGRIGLEQVVKKSLHKFA
jgi:hypothetical protein